MTGTSKRRVLAALLWGAVSVLAPVVEAGQLDLRVPSPARGTASVLTWSDRATARLDLTIDGRVVASCPSWRCVYRWPTGAGPDGTYSVTATRYDAQSNATDSTTRHVTVRNDRTRPRVTLSVPGAITSTAIVSASADDRSEITSLAVFLDGTPVKTVDADIVAFSWDSTSVPNGRHTFYAQATDASGNTGRSASIAVTVRNSASPPGSGPPPGGSPGSDPPPGGATGTGARLALVGTPATGPYSVQAIPATGLTASFVHFDVDGHYLLTDTQAPFYLFRDTGGSPTLNVLGPGSHAVRAQVYNAAGTKIGDATLPVWEGPPPPAAPVSPIFPANNIWNTPVDAAPLHALNAQWIDVINGHAGHNLHPDFGTTYAGRYNGIPLNIIAGARVPRAPVTLTAYASESDPIPAGGLPIPPTVLIGGDPGPFDPAADNHCLILDTDTHTLHEFYWLKRNGDGTYTAKQYSRWDYTSNALRRDGWTSADAAGLPVAPGLVRYDEVLVAVASGGVVPHAFRFTLDLTWKPHLWPARHDAPSGGPLNPPMGMRVRLKAAYDISGYSPMNQAILRTLKTYGMILADNGGDWFLNGVPDSQWNPDDLALLRQIVPDDAFEVVDVSGYIVSPDSGQAVTATDAGADADSGTDTDTDTTPAPTSGATRVAFWQQPLSATAGQAISPAVHIALYDASNHVVTNSSVPITLSLGSNPGHATLTGALTQTAPTGAVFFNDLAVSAPGTGYTLVASAPGLASATSPPFTVAASPTPSPTPNPTPTPAPAPLPSPTPTPGPGAGLSVVQSTSNFTTSSGSVIQVGTVTLTVANQFKLVFEEAANWGISQWYDSVNDPGASNNLTGPGDVTGGGCPMCAEPGLFQQVFYGSNPDDVKAFTRGIYYFPNNPRSMVISVNTPSKVVITTTTHPMVTAQGVDSNITNTITYSIYPNGRIYVQSKVSVAAAQSIANWLMAVLGLQDPTASRATAAIAPDTQGWIRSTATQNPFSWTQNREPYIYAYWRQTTPSPYSNWTKASVLLVPNPRNPNPGGQGVHGWENWKRWYYGAPLVLPAGGSVTQHYMIQLGTIGSSVLPNLSTGAVAQPIANQYLSNPTLP